MWTNGSVSHIEIHPFMCLLSQTLPLPLTVPTTEHIKYNPLPRFYNCIINLLLILTLWSLYKGRGSCVGADFHGHALSMALTSSLVLTTTM